MSRSPRIVSINGSPQKPSRTSVIIDTLLADIALQLGDADIHRVDVADLVGRPLAVDHQSLSPLLREQLRLIESADLIIAGSPVYKGSYTGLFKYLIDLVDPTALVDVPTVLIATGGSARHTLVIEHQLRPLFAFFNTATIPAGIYAHASEIGDFEILNADLRERIRATASRAVNALQSARSLEPAV